MLDISRYFSKPLNTIFINPKQLSLMLINKSEDKWVVSITLVGSKPLDVAFDTEVKAREFMSEFY
jgi:hypothetical protein